MKDEELADIDEFLAKAKAFGAMGAKFISPHTVITAPWVRLKCQFGCDGYNRSLCCPPNTPTPQLMREVLDGYGRALLVHCKGKVKPSKIVAKLEKEFFLRACHGISLSGLKRLWRDGVVPLSVE